MGKEIAIALIGVVGNLGGILLNNHLSKKDQRGNISLAKTFVTDDLRSHETDVNQNVSPITDTLQVSKTAILSFASGLATFFLFGLFAFVAIISGHKAIEDINNSDGALSGIRLAKTGLALGYLGAFTPI